MRNCAIIHPLHLELETALFFLNPKWDVESISLQHGIELSYCHYYDFLLPKPLHR